jgi:hypothetical protein
MALTKIEEYGSERRYFFDSRPRFMGPVGLIAIAAAPALALLVLLPLPMVAPVLSLVSFVMACALALYALYSKASRHASGVTIWNVAYTFTFIWLVAGIISNPMHLLDWFDKLSMVR